MEIFLLILSFLLMLLGIIGSFLPVLPGPFTGWAGLVVLHLTNAVPMSYTLLTLTFLVAALMIFMDYLIPVMGTKRFGGSKYGMAGAGIGLVVGLIAPIPFGVIIGPFVGAFIGELVKRSTAKNALRAAFGSFLGFLASTFMKFIISFIFFGFFLWKTIKYWDNFF